MPQNQPWGVLQLASWLVLQIATLVVKVVVRIIAPVHVASRVTQLVKMVLNTNNNR